MPNVSLGRGSARTINRGIGSNIKFAEQPDMTTANARKVTDPDLYSRFSVSVNSQNIVPNSTLITPGVIPTTVEQFRGVPGPLTIAGQFTIDGLPKRMELFFRQLMNAPSANVTDITGAGIGDASSQTLLAATSLAAAGVSLTTQPDADQGTIRLRVTVSGTITIGGAAIGTSNPLQIRVSGTDYSDQPVSEILTYTATGSSTTASYFKTVNANGIRPASSGTVAGASVAVAGTSYRKGVQIVSSPTYRQTPGLTLEVVNGQVTNTIVDGFITAFTFAGDREGNITYTFNVGGRIFEAAINPEGGINPILASSRGATAGGPYGSGNFTAIQDGQVPFGGTGVNLYATISGSRVKFPQLLRASVSLDNSTQFTPRLGTVFQGVAYNRQRIMVRLPEPQTQALLKLIRIRDRIQVELHREATVDDLKCDSEVISDHKNYQKWNKSVISLEDYISILNFSEPVSSLDYTITEDENIKLLDVIADPVAEDRIRAIELQDLGDRLLEVLNERECFILKAIASGWTRKEIGEHLGLNSQDISNRKLQAIKKIKEHVKNDPELTEVLKDMGLL